MDHHSIDRATTLLNQLSRIVNSYDDAQKKNHTSKTLVLESRFFSLFENNRDLINELRSSNDVGALQILEEIDAKCNIFQQIIDASNEPQNLVDAGDMNHLLNHEQSREQSVRTQNSIFSDFWFSMIFTIVICILFSIIWSQYSKSH